jgi:hypothetical protein
MLAGFGWGSLEGSLLQLRFVFSCRFSGALEGDCKNLQRFCALDCCIPAAGWEV